MIGFAPVSAHENTHRGGLYESISADIVMHVHLFIAMIQAYDTVREHVIIIKLNKFYTSKMIVINNTSLVA